SIELPVDEAPAEAIAAESTRVAPAPGAVAEEPTRPEIELPAEPTRPAAQRPTPAAPGEPAPAAGPAPADAFEEDVPSVVVSEDDLAAPSAGAPPKAPLAPEPTWVGEEPVEVPRSRAPLVAGLVIGGLVVLGGAGLGAWLLFGRAPSEPVATELGGPDPGSTTAPEEEPADEPAAPANEAAEGEAPVAADEGADALAAESEGDDATDETAEGTLAEAGDAAEGDGGEEGETATASEEAVPADELEGFELDLPRVSRRARRLSRDQRIGYATRFRNRALRAYRSEAYDEAEELYRRALTFNSWDVASVEGLARTTAQLERYPEALAWATLATERNPRSAVAYRVLGDVWRQAGHPDEAARAYRRGLAREPSDRWLRQRLREVEEE
ncbi:MAG TPA: tetratricopeptide repeat protein, partial [Sandaracinaceae bacterium LLY-WYZ-13_1]|nr:tetratricopeptide repeat protein [Sandaracinaceae bacterium LLY-WYZ-13_1]